MGHPSSQCISTLPLTSSCVNCAARGVRAWKTRPKWSGPASRSERSVEAQAAATRPSHSESCTTGSPPAYAGLSSTSISCWGVHSVGVRRGGSGSCGDWRRRQSAAAAIPHARLQSLQAVQRLWQASSRNVARQIRIAERQAMRGRAAHFWLQPQAPGRPSSDLGSRAIHRDRAGIRSSRGRREWRRRRATAPHIRLPPHCSAGMAGHNTTSSCSFFMPV